MKKTIFILFALMIISCKSVKGNYPSQTKEIDVLIFNRGTNIFEVIDEISINYKLRSIDTATYKGKIKYETLNSTREDILDFAFDQFKEVVDKYPNSRLYHKSLYNLARISSLSGYEKEEIKYLKIILNSNANDREKSGRNVLMANPYANFKNQSSRRLTEIYIKKGAFNEALKYKKINEKYPIQHFCGNAFAENKLFNAKQYAEIYIGLGQTKKALHFLLPYIFDNDLTSNTELVKMTVNTLKNNYDLSLVKTNFSNSIKNMYSKTEKKNNDEWIRYFIKYLDTEIEVPSWGLSFENDPKKIKLELEKVIHESGFYKALNNKEIHNKA